MKSTLGTPVKRTAKIKPQEYVKPLKLGDKGCCTVCGPVAGSEGLYGQADQYLPHRCTQRCYQLPEEE